MRRTNDSHIAMMHLNRRQFLRNLGVSAAALPFLAGLPSLTGAPLPQRRQRLIIMFSPNGTLPDEFWPDAAGDLAFKSILELPVRPQMVSVYLPPSVLLKVLPDIAARGCDELWLNPGADSDEVVAEAERLGLNVIQACSIVAVGVSPGNL